jgi:RNA polymerase sigma-70 factor (ECF subfamily)
MGAEPMDQLYRRYFPLVREKCRRMLADPSDAQDVAQETMMRLWKSDVQGLPPGQLTCWLYRTSTRLAIDALRRDAGRSQASVPDVAASERERPDELLHQRQMLASVARRVPQRELELAMLHRVDGLSQSELGAVMGMSDRSVRRLLTKVDARLERLRQESQ